MTGFGRGTAASEQILVTVEVKTVNGRQGEVSVRTPNELSAKEIDIQRICRKAISRGKATVTVHVEHIGGTSIQLNEERLAGIIRLLQRIENAAQLRQGTLNDQILTFQHDFLLDSEEKTDSSDVWVITQEALHQALQDCRDMRYREGTALEADILSGLSVLYSELAVLEKHAPERVTAARDTLTARLAELLGNASRIDSDRLATEVALLADKLDVNEECVRLHSHLQQFREAISEEENVGRRLNFLAQEIHREINTIGSKANHAETARHVVRMKEELERIREQVQNIA